MKFERSIDLICSACQKEIGESTRAMEKRIELMEEKMENQEQERQLTK